MPQLSDLTRDWTVHLVHHTHVDIGYTEPQDVILRKHAEFVAQALDFCAATDALPAGERFCWTCEVAWTVKAFLARYPEREAEFFRRVREGRVEVTALYLQLTDLFTHELLEETTDYALGLARRHGFEIVTAMNDDVNGWAWGLPALLSRRGVRFLDTGINETRALGVRPRPRPFWWSAPGGERVLLWHGNGYLHGNALGFDGPGAAERVAAYLKGLEDSGYPHDRVEIRIHGERHDNAPPGLWLSETVRRWNAEYWNPRLVLGTSRAWFEEVAAHWPAPITEHRAGWPDWWADGNGTAFAESALVRRAQADLVTLRSLAAATGQTPAPDRVDRAREAAAFFCEHTWGAWCSTDDPECLNSRAQWNTKAGFAYTAAIEARSLVDDAMAAEARRATAAGFGGGTAILVFNPLAVSRTDVVELVVCDADTGLEAGGWVPAPSRTDAGPAFHVEDVETGLRFPVAREPAIGDSARRAAQTVRFVATDVPARGFRRYRILRGELPAQAGCGLRNGGVESGRVQVEVDPDGRGIRALRDGETGLDWVRTAAEFALGEVVYESIPGPAGREKLCTWGGIRRDAPLQRTRLRFGAPEPLPLPFGMGLRLRATALPGSLRSLCLDITVYDGLPRVDLAFRCEKLATPEAEALYVAFPLADGAQPEVWLDVPGAVMRPGTDQVPGTATDWHSIQHWFAVAGARQTVAVASPEVPLVQVNGINTGTWQEALPPHNGVVMSWVFNNYWFTNFPAAQGGTLAWRYSLAAWPGAFAAGGCAEFAAALRRPLCAAVIPGAAG